MATTLKQPSERFWLLNFPAINDGLAFSECIKIMDALNGDAEKCCCLEYPGDNPRCPIHGNMYPHHRSRRTLCQTATNWNEQPPPLWTS